MRIYFLLFFLLMTVLTSGQSIDERVIYLDSSFTETNQLDHVYYRVISDQKKNKSPYKTTEYYKSGKIYSAGYSKEKNHLFPVGQFIKYYESGVKKAIENYKDGVKSGAFFSWYENGNPQTEGEYLKSDAEDSKQTIFKINQFWDAENTQAVKDGNGHYNLTDELCHDEGDIKDGFRDGMWQGTNNILRYTYIEKYADKKLVSGVSTDFKGVKRIYRELDSKPEFPGGMNDFYMYVGRNFKTPDIPNIKGTLFISFYVEKDGTIDNIKIIRGLAPEFNQEAYRVLAECPNWVSGKKRGISVRLQYSLPIKISGPN